eukprot:11164341-Alexandrium_andersonii.AAC.1
MFHRAAREGGHCCKGRGNKPRPRPEPLARRIKCHRSVAPRRGFPRPPNSNRGQDAPHIRRGCSFGSVL